VCLKKKKMAGNYSLYQKNDTNFNRVKDEGNLSCYIKLNVYKNGNVDIQREKTEKIVTPEIDIPPVILETKKSFKELHDYTNYAESFTQIAIPAIPNPAKPANQPQTPSVQPSYSNIDNSVVDSSTGSGIIDWAKSKCSTMHQPGKVQFH
jgi:hypothetical protein